MTGSHISLFSGVGMTDLAVGYDVPLPNGCFKCIGCGVILPKRRNWNQCASCDTRYPEEVGVHDRW